jgi:hypothetical protein
MIFLIKKKKHFFFWVMWSCFGELLEGLHSPPVALRRPLPTIANKVQQSNCVKLPF